MNKTACRFIDVLEYISTSTNGVTIAQLSRNLDIPKTSVFDIIHTAIEKDILAYGDSQQKTIRFGCKAIEIFGSYTSNLGFWPAVHGPLTSLSKRIARSVFFFRSEQREMILLDAVYTGVSFSPHANIGSRISWFNNIVGHTYLATLNDEEFEQLIETNDYQAGDVQNMRNNFQNARTKGFLVEKSISSGSITNCISVPIFNADHSCGGVIAVYDLEKRLSQPVIAQIVETMIEKALEISKMLGFQGKSLLAGFPEPSS